jgi:hypothetical protein
MRDRFFLGVEFMGEDKNLNLKANSYKHNRTIDRRTNV